MTDVSEAEMPALKKGLYLLHTDGGKKASAAGEKGEGAIGTLLKEPNGTLIEGAQISERLKDPVTGPTTAEYKALLRGLALARERGLEYLAVFSDSRTLVNQVNNLWEKRDHLAKLCEDARNALKVFKGTRFRGCPVSGTKRQMI